MRATLFQDATFFILLALNTMFVFRHNIYWFGAQIKISSNKFLRYQIVNLGMKGVLWKSFKVRFNLTLIRTSVVVWDTFQFSSEVVFFPVLNNLWRFVSLKDFPSTIFVCRLWFYYFFSSNRYISVITEILSAYSTLVLLWSACHDYAHDQDSADCDSTAADGGANCLPVTGGWEALLPKQSRAVIMLEEPWISWQGCEMVRILVVSFAYILWIAACFLPSLVCPCPISRPL